MSWCFQKVEKLLVLIDKLIDNSTVENDEDDTSTGDVEYMDEDRDYVSGSDSDLDDNPLDNTPGTAVAQAAVTERWS